MVKFKKIIASLCLVLFLSVPSTYTYGDIEGKKGDLEETNEKVGEVEEEINSTKKEKQNVESEIGELDSKISETNNELSTIENNIANIKVDIEKTKNEVEKSKKNISEKNESVNKRLRTMYKNGNDISYIQILLSSESIGELIQTFDVIRKVTDNDQKLLKEMEKEKKVLEVKEDKLISQEKQLKLSTVKLSNKKQELQLASRAKNDLVVELDQSLQRTEEEYNELMAESDRIASDIQRLEAEAQRKLEEQRKKAEEEARRKAEEEAKRKAEEALNNGSENTETEVKDPVIEKSSGHIWPTPGNGRITSPYGYRIHPISHVKKMHTGIDIGASSGSNVVAVKDGIVIEARAYDPGGYGKLVMITHDDGTTSLYAHNSSVLVSVGQYVKQGQSISKVGSTGASTGPHLHFEIRVNGNHQNPLNYVR